MSVIVTARQFNQGSSNVLRVAEKEPVYVTKRGEISHVVMSYEQYLQYKPKQSKTFEEIFSGYHAVAEISDDAFKSPRDVESWGVKEDLFD